MSTMLPIDNNQSLSMTQNYPTSFHNLFFDQPPDAIQNSSLTLQPDLPNGSCSQSTYVDSQQHSSLPVNRTNIYAMLTHSKTISFPSGKTKFS